MANNGKASAVIPEPPEQLSEWSKGFWRSVAGTRVKSIGRLSLLEEGLKTRDRGEEARIKIGNDLTLITPRSGCEHLHPLYRVERESRQLFIKVLIQLGLHREPYNAFPYGKSDDVED